MGHLTYGPVHLGFIKKGSSSTPYIMANYCVNHSLHNCVDYKYKVHFNILKVHYFCTECTFFDENIVTSS